MLPEKLRHHHVSMKKRNDMSTFTLRHLGDVETLFQALGSTRAQTIANGIFDLLVQESCTKSCCNKTCHELIERLSSCIDSLRNTIQSSLKRYALERMLWELRKSLCQKIFLY